MADITLQQAVKKFASDLATKVNTFISDVSTLEVRTYTTPSGQAEAFSADSASAGKATLQAFTSISFDGDTTICVPTDENGEINKAVWELHQSTVQQAMANRTAMIQAVGEAAASALKAVGMTG
jgi:L-aminopeptidase/D-esterase-like protein